MSENEQGGASFTTTLFRHNTWANLKLLDFCEGLSDQQLDSKVVGVYGTIRETMLHFVSSEVSYVTRVNSKMPANPPHKDEFHGFEQLKDAVRWAGDELLQLSLSADDDTTVFDNRPHLEVFERYKLAGLMVQAITHTLEHRTQIATIITELGLEPPDMAGWEYMIQVGDFAEVAKPAQG